MSKSKINFMDIIQLIIGFVFLFGLIFLFGPCPPKEDGSFMNCHWAGNALLGLAAVLAAMALIRLFAKNNGVKKGLSIGAIPVSVLAITLPGRLIGLCMMHSMRCHSVMTPAVRVFGVVIAVLSLIQIVSYGKKDE